MAPLRFRFRNFVLDSQARELHCDGALVPLPVSTLDCLIYLVQNRHRTVGRDELTSAVWGRVDISDVSLSHAIMRLRRLLGDAGNEQNSIRTLPRLGYRWIVEPTTEEASPRAGSLPQNAPGASPAATEVAADRSNSQSAEYPPTSSFPPPSRPARWRPAVLVLLASSAIAVAVLAVVFAPGTLQTEAAKDSPDAPRAMVLPAQVSAPDEWDWLRLGFMDLVANRLRGGDLVVTPSESVVGLVNANQLDMEGHFHSGAPPERAHVMLILPQVSLVNGLWNVRLEARIDNRVLSAESQAKDVVSAGRAVTDELLVKLGRTPPRSSEADPSLASTELEQRVNAAVLAGQLSVAASLLHDAPAAIRNSPEVGLSIAAVEFFSGDYEASRTHSESLLDQVTAQSNPKLRARVLNRLGAASYRLGRLEDADKAFAESIGLLELQNAPDTLATAYTGRGVIAGRLQNLEAAASYFGRARTLHELGNDTFGVAQVDLNLGAVAMDRGLPATAVPVFEDAASRFANLATPEALNSALRSLADAQSSLLEHARALATTDRFWPAETHTANPREAWWMTLTRAVVLVSNGRLHDADELVTRIRTSSDPEKDAVVRIETESLAANMALLRGDFVLAAELAGKALTPVLEETNTQDYAGAWLTRIRGLQRAGQTQAAAREVARFSAWSDANAGRAQSVYAMLAQADQAQTERNAALALERYATAMEKAERLGIPDDVVLVGEAYTAALLRAGQLDQASAIAGRLAPWQANDMRAAWVQAAMYGALGKADGARTALDQARQLAGERPLPAMPSLE